MQFMALSCAEVDGTYGDFRERHEATVWQRLNRVLGTLLVIAVWLGIISLFVPPYKRLMQSRSEIDNLQTHVNDQKLSLARQQREVSLLQNDPAYLETIARDRLDLMKEGEVIFRLEPASEKRKRDNASKR
jgi:cell division protein FtsB